MILTSTRRWNGVLQVLLGFLSGSDDITGFVLSVNETSDVQGLSSGRSSHGVKLFALIDGYNFDGPHH